MADCGTGPKSFASERLLQQGLRAEATRVEREVAIGREGCNREIPLAGVEVDGLRAHEYDRRYVITEGVEGIEQNSPCGDVERIRRARHVRSLASTR